MDHMYYTNADTPLKNTKDWHTYLKAKHIRLYKKKKETLRYLLTVSRLRFLFYSDSLLEGLAHSSSTNVCLYLCVHVLCQYTVRLPVS